MALGAAQMLAWGSSYYLPALLAAPMSRDLGVDTPTVFAAFSVALLVSAVLGPWVGRTIDRHGGRPMLVASNVVIAIGLLGLAAARGPWSLFAAWAILGVGMAAGLYEAAFTTLVRLHGLDARGVITGVTLLGGLASTVAWPLSALLESHIGWRGACVAWAVLHVVIGLPLNRSLPAVARSPGATTATPLAEPIDAAAATTGAAEHRYAIRTNILLAVLFAAIWFVSTAMASHLPRLLQGFGLGLAAAVAVASMVGPSQVAGRLLEFGLLRRLHPLLSARVAAALHPLGAVVLVVAGAPLAVGFALLHGIGNGILTIAKGTLPLALFGAAGYGRRQGWLTAPARLAQALAPWLFGVWLDRWGTNALLGSAAVGLIGLAALALLRTRAAPAAAN